MNLVTCSENCKYQKEGSCQLPPVAPISAVRVNGCSYFSPNTKKGDNAITNKNAIV